MKKVLASLVLASCLAVLAVSFTRAATDITAPTQCEMKRSVTVSSDLTCTDGHKYDIDSTEGICCVLNTMYNITDWIFVILVGIAGVFIIIGAMNLVMAAGSPDKVKSGRDYIMFAAIGLFIAFIARAIPGLVLLVVK